MLRHRRRYLPIFKEEAVRLAQRAEKSVGQITVIPVAVASRVRGASPIGNFGLVDSKRKWTLVVPIDFPIAVYLAAIYETEVIPSRSTPTFGESQ